ncbi:MAG TPA: hypothetical protein VLE46_18640 [Nitrospira sp.]|nr:hypothetical protein [Nitrospira sp.]
MQIATEKLTLTPILEKGFIGRRHVLYAGNCTNGINPWITKIIPEGFEPADRKSVRMPIARSQGPKSLA